MSAKVKFAVPFKSLTALGSLLLVLAASPAKLNAQDHPTRSISDSERRVLFDRGAFFSESASMPTWSNGYLVSREVQTFQSGIPNVRLYDQSGTLVRQAKIWFPDAQRVIIYSAIATPDGKIIASGHADKRDDTAFPFIAMTDTNGVVTDVLPTPGFVPTNICLGPDNTIWTLGGTGYDEHNHAKPGDTLRHFDIKNGQLSSFLPRSTFPEALAPHAAIRCSATGIQAYSRSARVYLEMHYDETAPRIYHADAPAADLNLIGFSVMDSNDVYGYFSRAARHGLFFLAIDDAAKTATWLPVQELNATQATSEKSETPGMVSGLWGSEGKLLIVSRSGDLAGMTTLHWVKPLTQ